MRCKTVQLFIISACACLVGVLLGTAAFEMTALFSLMLLFAAVITDLIHGH